MALSAPRRITSRKMNTREIESLSLPPCFKGNGSDEDSVTVWCKKFKGVVTIKRWSEDVVLQMFELSLGGPAGDWKVRVSERDESSKFWSIENWLMALQQEFKSNYVEVINSFDGLFEMRVFRDETLSNFNNRYRRYLAYVPKDMYTEEGVKDIYLKIFLFLFSLFCWLSLSLFFIAFISSFYFY